MNAVIYARYSSHAQREESIEGQLRECHAYAERCGLTVVGEYIDRALSGKTDNRADFQRMIRDSEKNRFQAVIMYTLDRFARNRYDSAMYKARLKKNGVRVLYAKQYIPDEPEGIILESVLEGYAEYYSENLARNVRRGMRENALACKVNGGTTPLGYAIGTDHTYVIDPASAAIVREIFQMYADGWSAKQIADYCNARGYRTAQHTVFNKNSLRSILTNTKYIGVYKYGDIVREGGMPAIVSKELFERVQERYRHNFAARARGKAREDYLLTTKLFCGHCGAMMVGDSGTAKSGTTYRYYTCACRKYNKACAKRPERKEWIEDVVVRHTIQVLMNDECLDRIATKAMEILEREAADTSLLPALQSELQDVSSRLDNLMKAVEKGIDPSIFADRIKNLADEKKDLETRIAVEESKAPFLTKDRILFWLDSFRHGDLSDPRYKQRLIDTFVNSIFISDSPDGKSRTLIFTFNVSSENTSTLTLSDIEGHGSPLCAYPNFFFLKYTFGFIVKIEDIG